MAEVFPGWFLCILEGHLPHGPVGPRIWTSGLYTVPILQPGHTQTFHCLPLSLKLLSHPCVYCSYGRFEGSWPMFSRFWKLSFLPLPPSPPPISLSFSPYFSGANSFLVLAECIFSSTQVWHLLSALPTALYSSTAGFLQANRHNAFPGGLLINSSSPISLIRNNLANLGERNFITN